MSSCLVGFSWLHATEQLSPCKCCPITSCKGADSSRAVQVALDELGLDPCFHARFFPYLTDLFDAMYEYASGRRTDLSKFPARELFAGFRAAVDIPPPLIRPVLESFPNAKARPEYCRTKN